MTWGTFGEYLDVVRTAGSSINYAFLVGHNTLRAAAGLAGRRAARTPSGAMERLVAEAMESGAIGMSTGLEFDPGRQAPEAEIARMARVVGRHGGMYASHIRNRSDALGEAMDEFFRYAEAAGGRGQVSHLNVRANTGAAEGAWEAAVARIEQARRDGLDVLTDNISMTHGPGLMVGILPPWVLEDGTGRRARAPVRSGHPARGCAPSATATGGSSTGASGTGCGLSVSPQHPELNGLPFPEIAARRGTDEWDGFFDLLVDAGPDMAKLLMYGELYSEEHLAEMVAHPLFMLAVDAMNSTTTRAARGSHAAAADLCGPDHLPHEVRARHRAAAARGGGAQDVLDARHPLRAARARPAGARLPRRRRRAGPRARSARRPRWSSPTVYAEGVTHVLVNGAFALDAGEHTGALAGRTLLRS